MRKKIYTCFMLGIAVFMSACHSQNTSFPKVTHIPFQMSEADDWGLIDLNGKILFEDEFDGCISIAVNGIFYHQTEDGFIEYFTATKSPESINEERYISGGYYSEGLIPVVAPEQDIAFIRKTGEVAFSLMSEGDDPIVAVNAYFSDGRCLVRTRNEKYGYIDTDGNLVIKPRYSFAAPFSEGIALVQEKDGDEYKLIDLDGQTIAQLNDCASYCGNMPIFSDGLLTLDDKVFNRNGDMAFRVASKIDCIFPFINGHAVFEDESWKYGLINNKGEITIRAKYNDAGMIIGDRVLFYDSDREKTICTTFSGDKIFSSYDIIYPLTKDRYISYNYDDGKYCFVDKEGKPIDMNDYVSLGYGMSINNANNFFLAFLDSIYQWVYSDRYDAKAAVSSVLAPLNEKGIGLIDLGMPVTKLTSLYDMGDSSQYTYDYWHSLEGVSGKENLKTTYIVEFSEAIANYYGYNEEAEVQHVFIHMDLDDIFVSNVDKRTRNAIIDYLNDHGYSKTQQDVDWLDDKWDVYEKNDNAYLIAVNKSRAILCLESY